jgi:hypothetical protein
VKHKKEEHEEEQGIRCYGRWKDSDKPVKLIYAQTVKLHVCGFIDLLLPADWAAIGYHQTSPVFSSMILFRFLFQCA